MDVKQRQAIEKRIVKHAVSDLLKAGYFLGVNDGEVETITRSNDKAAILAAMFTTDQDWLMVYESANAPSRFGWISFVYGNDGWDVMSDYTTNLDDVLKSTDELSQGIGDSL